MNKAQTTNWFEVDREGLRELHSNFPTERMVAELVQNCWDEDSTTCHIELTQQAKTTTLVVLDDNPVGFKNIADAFTLFRSTSKRSDPTKRGRFNYGEKIVLARSLRATLQTTTGGLRFDPTGRHTSTEKRASGSRIEVVFDRWTDKEFEKTLIFCHTIIPPAECATFINGQQIKASKPLFSNECTLPTEILKDRGDGNLQLTKTSRKTILNIRPAAGSSAMLFEMGLPVCEIEGHHDLDIMQKIPVSQDRTTVSTTFLREIYAELLNALKGTTDVQSLGTGIVAMAMESNRTTPEAAAGVFKAIYGERSLLQSGRPDSDQEAARHNYTLVPSRTFGSDANEKLREGGIKTSHDQFSRDLISGRWEHVDHTKDKDLANFVACVETLAKHLYPNRQFRCSIAKDLGTNAAQNENGNHLVFCARHIEGGRHPISKFIDLVLHEMGHCLGDQHDCIYDEELERLTREIVVIAINNPGLLTQFEPEIVQSTKHS